MKLAATYRVYAFSAVTALLIASCSIDEPMNLPQMQDGGICLEFISDPMDNLMVGTKASDQKNDAEKQIHNLHIFFFDKDGQYLEGNYLSGYPDATAKDVGGYYSPGQGVTIVKLDNSLINSPDAATATVYAIANVNPDFFMPLDENGRPKNVPDMHALEALDYPADPEEDHIFLELPETGMPMSVKKNVDLTGQSGSDEDRVLQLQALMARVDINLQINSNISGSNGRPSFTMTGWKAHNLPCKTGFAELAERNLEEDGTTRSSIVQDEFVREIQTANNGSGSISFSFYMYENIQKGMSAEEYDYPDKAYINDPEHPDMNVDRRQNYKPLLLGEDTARAAAVELRGYYSTYNDQNYEATYMVSYTLYLGSNHIDNFEINRNHQYKNNITVKGLIANDQHSQDEFTFDARVNVDTEDNKYYISMLREREHDAHFCVTPMDVYFFAPESLNPQMQVIIGEVPAGTDQPSSVPDWIRLERIDARDMASGKDFTYSNQTGNNYSIYSSPGNGTHLTTGPWTAGNGKRAFFTTDLFPRTDGSPDMGMSVLKSRETIINSRDRIYFYIDENLKLEDRYATITLIYYEDDGSGRKEVSRRTIQIGQVHLLPVEVPTYDENGNLHNDGNSHPIIYMEQFEEYLDHYDPLDVHNTHLIYHGLQWLADGELDNLYENRGDALNPGLDFTYPSNLGNVGQVYCSGYQYTSFLVERTGQEIMHLNQEPVSAFQYCYNRNKRKSDGSIPHLSYGETIIGHYYQDGDSDENPSKWFLPGIRQMEDALSQYYNTFPEFQNNFYWSASAGEEAGGTSGQNRSRARATAIKPDGSYHPSGGGDGDETRYAYELGNGGYALRSEELRIRAFRIDLNPTTY